MKYRERKIDCREENNIEKVNCNANDLETSEFFPSCSYWVLVHTVFSHILLGLRLI